MARPRILLCFYVVVMGIAFIGFQFIRHLKR